VALAWNTISTPVSKSEPRTFANAEQTT
jgi:hypothetical protein